MKQASNQESNQPTKERSRRALKEKFLLRQTWIVRRFLFFIIIILWSFLGRFISNETKNCICFAWVDMNWLVFTNPFFDSFVYFFKSHKAEKKGKKKYGISKYIFFFSNSTFLALLGFFYRKYHVLDNMNWMICIFCYIWKQYVYIYK